MRSQRKGKKYKVEHKGKEIHFGASGYRIKPGTPAGDSYCARSAGLKGQTTLPPLIIGLGDYGDVRATKVINQKH